MALPNGSQIGSHNLTLKLQPNGGRYSKTLYWQAFGKSWLVFRLAQHFTCRLCPNNVATNACKLFVALSNGCLLENLPGASVVLVPQFVWQIASAVMTAHWLLSPAICSNDDFNWPVRSSSCCPFMIYPIFICVAYRPLSLVVWSSTAYHDDRHGRTIIIYGYLPVAIHIRLFYGLCMICQASSRSICSQKPGFAFPDLPSMSSSYKSMKQYSQDKWFLEFNLVALFFHGVASLVMA